jgi:hypothetical protein
MSVQTLLISLAVTCVAVGITFLYFRNRMNKTEQKVDLMFQLIQEHEKNSRMANQMQMHQLHQANATAQFQNNETELINISDNENEESEEEYDSDDSAEISDEEEDKLVIQNDPDGNVENTVKMISLTLDGAETSVAELTSENLMETLEVNSLSVNHDGESTPSIDELDEVQLSDNDDLDGSQHADQESNGSKSDDGTLNNFVVTKKTSTSPQETSSSDEDNTSEVEKEDTVASTNYEKLTKAQLKKLAEDKGLAGYKKLTKTGLVDLLNQNQ